MALEQHVPGSGRKIREDGEVINVADKSEESLGGKGLEIISDTAEHTPSAGYCYFALHILSDTIISAFVADSSAPVTGTLTGVSFAAGTWLFGKYTSITLTSGSVIGYLGVI